MLVSFSVENYKSFENEGILEMAPGNSRSKSDHIRNDCLKVAAIYGPNASGKSNLIQALGMMKRIATSRYAYGKEPLYNWNSGKTITSFCIEFSKNKTLYHYEIDVESIRTVDSRPSKTMYLYPVRREALFVSDLENCISRDGSIHEREVYDRRLPADSHESWILDQLSEYTRLCSLLSSCNEYSPSRKLKLQSESKRYLHAYAFDDVDRLVKDEERKAQLVASHRRYMLRNSIKRTKRLLNLYAYQLGNLPKTITSEEDYSWKSLEYRNASVDSDEIRFAKDVYQWFMNDLVILGTSDILIPDSEDLDPLSEVLKELNLGIESVIWEKKGDIAFRQIVDSLDIDSRTIYDSAVSDSHNAGYVSSFIKKTNLGVFRFVIGSNKCKVEELVPEHTGRPKLGLYSESDGTVRLIELSSVLIPTTRETTFVVDELDRRLHPLLSKRFIELYMADDSPFKQLIFSTHESELMTTELFRKDEIWFVQKIDGRSEMISLDRVNKVNYNRRLSRLYLDDKVLPGIPHISKSDSDKG